MRMAKIGNIRTKIDDKEVTCMGGNAKIFGPQQYVPILKWKRGEQRALSEITPQTKNGLTPLIELVPLQRDLDTGDPKETLEDYTNASVDALVTGWGTSELFFLDCREIADEVTNRGTTGPDEVFDKCSTAGLKFIPVIGLQRSAIEIASALQYRTRGICLRLTTDDLRPSLATDLQVFLRTNRLNNSEVDINMDFGALENLNDRLFEMTVRNLLTSIPNLGQWRTLTLTASAFPEHMGVIQTHSTGRVSRTEWLVWSRLYSVRTQLPRLPNFGDYVIQYPLLPVLDYRIVQPSANIRYTLDDSWLFLKAASFKRHGGTQFIQLAQMLVNMPDYYGSTHCAGCRLIDDIQQGAATPGNLETWRRIGTTHHSLRRQRTASLISSSVYTSQRRSQIFQRGWP